MKEIVETLVAQGLQTLAAHGVLTLPESIRYTVERTRDPSHGDFACNAAMVLGKVAGMAPRAFAEKLIAALPASAQLAKVEIAGPGFINFTLVAGHQFAIVKTIHEKQAAFARPNVGNGAKVLIEFVSANPTGPMHVGHGRGAAYGSALANVLAATGFTVEREYYINDAGRQADVLAVSLWLRYLELLGEKVAIPSRAYPSPYVIDNAKKMLAEHGEKFKRPYADLIRDIPADSNEDGDAAKIVKEKHLDALIERTKQLLGDDYRTMQDCGLNEQLGAIKATLDKLNVKFDRWYSERTLVQNGAVESTLNRLRDKDAIYEKDGALWLKTEAYGDEKDRVLVKKDGALTYFTPDIAYHLDKLDRGYDLLIDVWGADHHGYIARMRAAIEQLSGKGKQFHVALIQFVTLSSGRMGKRSGNFVTLNDLIDEAGADATRFFYLTRSPEQHLEFDIELARSQSKDNPVYYIQYAHARICSVFRTAVEKGLSYDAALGLNEIGKLDHPKAADVAVRLSQYPEMLAVAARNEAPHMLTHYLNDLATDFHSWYNDDKVLVDDAIARNTRMVLCAAARIVLADGLAMLGVSAPEQM
ncbi:arginine--tRNA ligase [Permianibacter sp. IMCC34836]|uniref:arginine--tRNA ligase n=1 Tax=Permianibacter fluminis TaxID=2738515 RepID=UPI00155232A2|nr:arginine--tRNA ligase [Permianibacter fluminis]NQD36127.1 arginine--tRNA ligase [Permianibacter fluminis]